MTDITLTKNLARAAEQALSEALGAAGRFPSNVHMHAALGEEVGELANALIEHSRGKLTRADVYAEAMQVAAMALRVAIEGSAEFPDYAFEEASVAAFQPTGSKAPKLNLTVRNGVQAMPLLPTLDDLLRKAQREAERMQEERKLADVQAQIEKDRNAAAREQERRNGARVWPGREAWFGADPHPMLRPIDGVDADLLNPLSPLVGVDLDASGYVLGRIEPVAPVRGGFTPRPQ